MWQSDYEGAVGCRKTSNNHNLRLFRNSWFTELKDFHKPQIGIGATGWDHACPVLSGIPLYRNHEYSRIKLEIFIRLLYYNLIVVLYRRISNIATCDSDKYQRVLHSPSKIKLQTIFKLQGWRMSRLSYGLVRIISKHSINSLSPWRHACRKFRRIPGAPSRIHRSCSRLNPDLGTLKNETP